IYDPLLPAYLSPVDIISSSILTLSEAIEIQFFSKEYNQFSLIAIKLISSCIVRATYNKNDWEALETLLKAGMLLGLTNVRRNEGALTSCFVIPIMRKVDVSYSTAFATMLPFIIEVFHHVKGDRSEKI